MARKKAMLILDPDRRDAQLAILPGRAEVLLTIGDQLWVTLEERQVSRLQAQGITVQIDPIADVVEVPAVAFDPLLGEPDPPSDLTADLSPPLVAVADTEARPPYQIVQFIGPTQPEWIDGIAEGGGEYVQPLPGNAVIFRLDQSQAAAAREFEYVRWMGPYHPAYALSYELAGRDAPFDAASLSGLTIEPEQLPAREEGNIVIAFFEDVDLTDLITDTGMPIEGRLPVDSGLRIIRVSMEGVIAAANGPAAVRWVLRVPGVMAVTRFAPPTVSNDRAGVVTLVNQVRDFGQGEFALNLDGAGEIAGVIDTGLDLGSLAPGVTMHAAIAGRVLMITNYNNPADRLPDTAPPHGTHVTGTIAGNGANFTPPPRGVAPASQIIFQGPITEKPLHAIGNAHIGGARVHNNSWCTDVRSPLRPTNNAYLTAGAGTSHVLDRLCYLYGDSLVVFSANNFETDNNADGQLDMNRLSPEAVAKNVLTVGASENLRPTNGNNTNYSALGFSGRYNNPSPPLSLMANDLPGPPNTISDNVDQVAVFSCRGRVPRSNPNGRIKPDIVAPGTNIISLASQAAGAAVSTYTFMSGTSMAAPHVSGAALLVRQFFRTRFGQLGRPLAIQITPIPAAPPAPAFIDRPAVALRAAEVMLAWIPPTPPGVQRDIVGARYQRSLVAITPNPVTLATNVGDHPAPVVARHGTATLLLFRDRNNHVQLQRLRADLTPDPAFAANALNVPTRADAAVPPAMLVAGDQVAVVWADAATRAINFQRLNAGTGAKIDANPIVLGDGSELGVHGAIAWNGNSYAVAWVNSAERQSTLALRLIDATGHLTPTNAPVVVHQQAQPIRDPHIIWSPTPTPGRFAIVWADDRIPDNGQIYLRLTHPSGQLSGAEVQVFLLIVAKLRRPRLAARVGGFSVLWESNAQHDAYDLYLLQTDASGTPDLRSLRALSDIPTATSGFAAVNDSGGSIAIWQGAEQDAADRLTLFGLSLSPQGLTTAAPNPWAPQLLAGRYVPHTLHEPTSQDVTHVAIAWAGGIYFLLRTIPAGIVPTLQLVCTTADGVPDVAFGSNGVRQLFPAPGFGIRQYECVWTGVNGRLACIGVETLIGRNVYVALCDGQGNPAVGFGTNGVVRLTETQILSNDVSPQIAHRDRPFRLCVVYGRHSTNGAELRLVFLDENGAEVGSRLKLADANGTARHGWFHTVPSGMIAVWHQRPNPNSATIAIRLFRPNGSPMPPAPPQLSQGLAGESVNASIAPRPRRGAPTQREYAVVWQHRPAPDQPWRILFSRVDSQGKTIARSPDGPASGPNVISTRQLVIAAPIAGPGDVPAEGWGAVHPQIVSTFTHDPPGAPIPSTLPAVNLPLRPQPGYGCAWLEYLSAGTADQIGKRVLRFVSLDENGRPITTQRPPFVGPALPTVQVPSITVSDPQTDVEDFRLIWNGRSFRLTWTELRAGVVRHQQTTLTRYGNTLAYSQPSAALLRATLINGATNIDSTRLPNLSSLGGPSGLGGYGWGRLNMRQSLSPAAPVTFHARDDNAVGTGRSVTYQFALPRDTRLLRITLCWNDLPGATLQNILRLRVIAPNKQEYFGNVWDTTQPYLSQQHDSKAAVAAEGIHTTQQVVINNPRPGEYSIEVRGIRVRTHNISQFQAQPFALIFVGSGAEIRFLPPGPGAAGGYAY
ncbi:MAG TPA: S8 family serine peptidase [Herpetosiphonaceae bacterium]